VPRQPSLQPPHFLWAAAIRRCKIAGTPLVAEFQFGREDCVKTDLRCPNLQVQCRGRTYEDDLVTTALMRSQARDHLRPDQRGQPQFDVTPCGIAQLGLAYPADCRGEKVSLGLAAITGSQQRAD
jgi:hypothetical protein